jgi:hypothetical protein
MRSLILRFTFSSLLAGLAGLVGCGAPSVDVPSGNAQATSDESTTSAKLLAPPFVQGAPARWPYAKIAFHGTSTGATRVVVDGAGNPIAANVQPIEGTFCVEIDLDAPSAHYDLTFRGQSDDGQLSLAATLGIDRADDAPAPTDAKLCDGTPIN